MRPGTPEGEGNSMSSRVYTFAHSRVPRPFSVHLGPDKQLATVNI